METYVPAWQTIIDNYPMLQDGGRYQPPDCEARHRVALIIPFRDRDIHLKIFLNNIHAFLMRQQLDYGIFVIDLVLFCVCVCERESERERERERERQRETVRELI